MRRKKERSLTRPARWTSLLFIVSALAGIVGCLVETDSLFRSSGADGGDIVTVVHNNYPLQLASGEPERLTPLHAGSAVALPAVQSLRQVAPHRTQPQDPGAYARFARNAHQYARLSKGHHAQAIVEFLKAYDVASPEVRSIVGDALIDKARRQYDAGRYDVAIELKQAFERADHSIGK
jgi:hypothetical protein